MTDAWAGRTFTNAWPLKLDGVQRRIVKAMSEPGTMIRVLTGGGVTLGREDFETEDEWRAFLRPLGLSGLGTGCRLHLALAGDQHLTDDDFDSPPVEVDFERGYVRDL